MSTVTCLRPKKSFTYRNPITEIKNNIKDISVDDIFLTLIYDYYIANNSPIELFSVYPEYCKVTMYNIPDNFLFSFYERNVADLSKKTIKLSLATFFLKGDYIFVHKILKDWKKWLDGNDFVEVMETCRVYGGDEYQIYEKFKKHSRDPKLDSWYESL